MPILNARFLIVITGAFIFAISYVLSKEKNKIISSIIYISIIIFGLYNNIELIKTNYDKTNDDLYEYFHEHIEKDDVFISEQIGVVSLTSLYFTANDSYLVQDKYKVKYSAFDAYSPEMTIVYDYEFPKKIEGRVWLISENEPLSIGDDIKVIYTRYRNITYYIKLVEKESENNNV